MTSASPNLHRGAPSSARFAEPGDGLRLAFRTAGDGVEHGRWLAEQIPGARLLELRGDDHLWWVPDPADVADPILELVREHT